MTTGERLRALRTERGLTIEDVARRLQLSFSLIGMYERGVRQPPTDKLRLLADFYGVSVSYLLGETDDPRPIATRAREFLEREAMPVVPIPILGIIHAGDAIPAEEHIEGWTAIPEHQARGAQHFALRVRGDCFEYGERPIHDGDVVVVRQQDSVEDGKIAVVLWPDVAEAQLRRVYRRDGTVVLRADNPRYPPELVRKRQLTILGVVVGIQTEPVAAKEV